MIDHKHQGKGYGKKATLEFLDYFHKEINVRFRDAEQNLLDKIET